MPLPCLHSKLSSKTSAQLPDNADDQPSSAGAASQPETTADTAEAAAASAAAAAVASAATLAGELPPPGVDNSSNSAHEDTVRVLPPFVSAALAAAVAASTAAAAAAPSPPPLPPAPVQHNKDGSLVVDTGGAQHSDYHSSDDDDDGPADAAPSSSNKDALPHQSKQVQPVKKKRQNGRVDPSLSEAEQRAIWMNLGQAHKYAQEHYKLEVKAEERTRIEKRAYKIIEQAAKVSRRTNLGIIVALTHLDNATHAEPHDYVYASPNLCDTARPTLRAMAQTFSSDFKRVMHTYREAARLEAAEQMAANKILIADKARLQQQDEELLARIKELENLAAPSAPAAASTSSSLDLLASQAATSASPADVM